MIAVIFEVPAKPTHARTYFDIAAELKSELELIDGFISVERFESLTEKGKFLSLSFLRPRKPSRNGAPMRNIATRKRVAKMSYSPAIAFGWRKLCVTMAMGCWRHPHPLDS